MKAMTYKNNITHSFDVIPNVCYKTLDSKVYLCYVTFITHKT